MAIAWMDNFNIYGTDAGRDARMLNGVYAQISLCDLVADPDPTAGGAMVLSIAANPSSNFRKVLPAARTTVGVAARHWLDKLPIDASKKPNICRVTDQNNVTHCYVYVDPSGFLQVIRNDAAGEVNIGSTLTPVITSNAWKHIECKFVLDPVNGSIEVRIEGVTVINLAAIRTTSNVAGAIASALNVSIINGLQGAGTGAPTMYVKDFIIWDGTTGFNNNFMGSCQVLKIIPDADVSLNWTPNPADGIGFNKINAVTPDDDVTYISAPAPGIPAPYVCSLSDLPVTVTSVRGVMPIHRSRKTDGGDGNIQIGLISGASTGLGVDRPMTTAYTYYWDIYDADPATAAAWSRASVNALDLQINRTL